MHGVVPAHTGNRRVEPLSGLDSSDRFDTLPSRRNTSPEATGHHCDRGQIICAATSSLVCREVRIWASGETPLTSRCIWPLMKRMNWRARFASDNERSADICLDDW